MFLVRLRPSGQEPRRPVPTAVAVLECMIPSGEDGMESTIPIDVLDIEFFDENTIIVVYRTHNHIGEFLLTS